MPFLAPVAMLAGTAVSAAGALEQGQAAKEQADYAAAVAQRNAAIAGMEQATTLAAGETRTAETSLAGAAKLGAVKTSMAANNVDINTGSPVLVRGSERMKNVLDTATTAFNAQKVAWGEGNQAVGFASQAEADKVAGENAQKASYFNAAGDILKGATSFAGDIGSGGGGFIGNASATAGGGDATAGLDWNEIAPGMSLT